MFRQNDAMPDADIEIGTGRHLRLCRRGGWEFVTRTNARGVAAIVALTPNRRVVLVEQHRPPIGGPVIELPAGLVGDEPAHAEESPLEAARRELLEETGFATEHWTDPGIELASSAGLSDETVRILVAQDVRPVPADDRPTPRAGEESIVVHQVPLDELGDWLIDAARRGRSADGRVWAVPAILACVLGR